MKKILVPFDFSKPAVNAYKLALDVAQQSKGEIHLLHVIELPVLQDSVLVPVLTYEENLIKDLKSNAEKQFRKAMTKNPAGNVKVVEQIQLGGVSKTIIDYIIKHAIDLVLMGSHGASGLREVFIGSNAEKIVRRSPVPVLVLKDYFKGPVKNIVFPNTLDTEKQEDLVMKVKALQDFFGAKIHIVWINTPRTFTADVVTLKRLQGFAKRFMFKNYTINVFNHLHEEEGIREFAAISKSDMIAMGTNSRTGISHVLNGSVAEDIVNRSRNLVWTYSLKNEPVLS